VRGRRIAHARDADMRKSRRVTLREGEPMTTLIRSRRSRIGDRRSDGIPLFVRCKILGDSWFWSGFWAAPDDEYPLADPGNTDVAAPRAQLCDDIVVCQDLDIQRPIGGVDDLQVQHGQAQRGSPKGPNWTGSERRCLARGGAGSEPNRTGGHRHTCGSLESGRTHRPCAHDTARAAERRLEPCPYRYHVARPALVPVQVGAQSSSWRSSWGCAGSLESLGLIVSYNLWSWRLSVETHHA
jgi:hypothetical protein